MLSVAAKPPRDGLELRLREVKDRRSQPRRRQAHHLLDQLQSGQVVAATPPAATLKDTSKRKRRRPKSKNNRSKSATRSMVNSVVTPEARRHGDYQAVDFKLVEVTEGGKRKEKTAKVIRNVGRTAVERWEARGHLTERGMAAILFYQEAWTILIGEPRVTANYSPAVSRNANASIELWASSRIRAKESLRLLDQEVFFRIPAEHFQVWQNVVIWDQPAGVAGGPAGFLATKQSEAAARVIVCLVAKMIADVVIDSSRKDFGELLLDIDAPRKPGRREA